MFIYTQAEIVIIEDLLIPTIHGDLEESTAHSSIMTQFFFNIMMFTSKRNYLIIFHNFNYYSINN